MVQWLRCWAPKARGLGWIPGQGTRSHMLQLKFVHAAANSQRSQIKSLKKFFFKVPLWQRAPHFPGTQWLRIYLSMQGTRVLSLVQDDPTCWGPTNPVHNYWGPQTLQPVLCNKKSHHNEKPMQHN